MNAELLKLRTLSDERSTTIVEQQRLLTAQKDSLERRKVDLEEQRRLLIDRERALAASQSSLISLKQSFSDVERINKTKNWVILGLALAAVAEAVLLMIR
uniref:Uncharacterized protein n=1 Tax=viral metagenome TaxID=1070528 RepID=A0A6M3LHX5_9ZZZZ